MGEAKEVKLYGFWASSDCAIVRHALALKGVAFEYVELEDPDINRKNDCKKAPVLVVDGESVVEPLVILEFIDKLWKDPPLLPEEPHLRARVRFWAEFFYQKLVPTSFAIIQSEGEALQRANNKFIAHMTTLEDGIARDVPDRGAFINGDRPGIIDLIMGSCSNGMRTLEEVAGVELLQKDRMPILSSSMANFGELEIATAIPFDKLVQLHWDMREKARSGDGSVRSMSIFKHGLC